MEDAKNDKQSAQQSSTADEHRHKQAREFTRELVEEQFSSTDASDSPGHTK